MDKMPNNQYRTEVFERNFEMDSEMEGLDEFTYSIEDYFEEHSIEFLSEWVFDERVHEYTKFKDMPLQIGLRIPTQYTFPDSDQTLNKAIEEFHVEEGLPRDSFIVFNTEGSTPMISSVILWAYKMGFKKIYSIFPLYFTIHKMCDVLEMDILPCNTDLTHDNFGELSLPHHKSFLIITDPIWITGRHHSTDVFKQLAEWQNETASVVFVDASFSYMDWGTPVKKEPAILLNPNLTMRLVCPTKSLCLQGIRFSYLLCPEAFSKEIARITVANIGSSCFFSHSLRKRLFTEMVKPEPNPVGVFASERYDLLKDLYDEKGLDYIVPDCGFFMFAHLGEYFKKKGIRKNYFWISRIALDILNPKYEGWAKINLVSREKTIKTLIRDLGGQ